MIACPCPCFLSLNVNVLQLKLMQDNVWPTVLELNFEFRPVMNITKRTRTCVSCNVSYNSTFTVDSMYSTLVNKQASQPQALRGSSCLRVITSLNHEIELEQEKKLDHQLQDKVSYMKLICKDFISIDKHCRQVITDMGTAKRQKKATEEKLDSQWLR